MKTRILILVVSALFFLSACSSSPITVDTDGCVVEIDLDDEQDFNVEMEPGDVLLLDMAQPKSMKLAGAKFDPNLLRLDTFVEFGPEDLEDADDTGRAYYTFTALGTGETVVLIRMRSNWTQDKRELIYKTVNVVVEE